MKRGILFFVMALAIGCAPNNERVNADSDRWEIVQHNFYIRTARHKPTGRCFLIVRDSGGVIETSKEVCQ